MVYHAKVWIGTPTVQLVYGVSCESVDWNPYSSIGLWCIMRERGLEPLQFSWFRATILWIIQQLHNGKGLTCWHAAEYTIQWLLVSPYLFCHGWSDTIVHLQRKAAKLWAHIFSAMDGLTQSYIFKQGCKTVRFRLRVHTLRFETATWNPRSFPTCDLCEADDDVQEQHAKFHCTHPYTVCLRRRYESLFSEAIVLHQNNNKLYFSTWLSFMNRLVVTRFERKTTQAVTTTPHINTAAPHQYTPHINAPSKQQALRGIPSTTSTDLQKKT